MNDDLIDQYFSEYETDQTRREMLPTKLKAGVVSLIESYPAEQQHLISDLVRRLLETIVRAGKLAGNHENVSTQAEKQEILKIFVELFKADYALSFGESKNFDHILERMSEATLMTDRNEQKRIVAEVVDGFISKSDDMDRAYAELEDLNKKVNAFTIKLRDSFNEHIGELTADRDTILNTYKNFGLTLSFPLYAASKKVEKAKSEGKKYSEVV